jgi:hypothetical protein
LSTSMQRQKFGCLLTELSANDVDLSPELRNHAEQTLILDVSTPQPGRILVLYTVMHHGLHPPMGILVMFY